MGEERPMKRSTCMLVIGVCLTMIAGGCAATKQASLGSAKASGFFGDYSKLTPGDPAKGQALLVYINPDARWAHYKKVMIDPVTFWGDESGKLLPPDQHALTTYFRSALETQFGTKFQLVDKPGPGVIQLHVAITDANSAIPVLRTVSLVVPQARALNTLQEIATGHWAFAGSCQIEGRLTDAATGQMLGEMVDKRLGGSSLEAAAQWQWGDVQNALDAWAAKYAARVYAWTSGAAAPGSAPAAS